MHSVFIAGSRAVSKLNPQIKERLDNIVKRNLAVLLGDANGADKAVQRFLAEHGYRHVTIYCMDTCRNNLGDWPVRFHTAPSGTKHDRHYFQIKDAAMAKDATCGFMLWDGASKGTLTNTINLLNAGKKVVLYISPHRRIFEMHTLQDFYEALSTIGVREVSHWLASQGITRAAAPRLLFGSTGAGPR